MKRSLGWLCLSIFLVTLTNAQTAINGSKRATPPRTWAKLAWPEKKALLTGMFAPTQEELALMQLAYPKTSTAQPKQARKLLVFWQCQYPHASIATGNEAFLQIGKTTGAYTATLTDDPTAFTTKNLKNYDAVLLNNTTSWERTLGETGSQALLDYVKSGGGLIGIHAAADACQHWKPGAELIGGIFRCHPWLPTGTWAFKIESPGHRLNQVFAGNGFWHRDEVYMYREGSHKRNHSRVLLSLDMTKEHNCSAKEIKPQLKELATKDGGHPVAWIHEIGKGRVFYSNLGHNNMTYWQPLVLKHYLDGIQYALGDIEADATPSAMLESPAPLAIAPPLPPKN